MPFLTTRSLLLALLGLCSVSAHADSLAPAPQCAQLNQAFARSEHASASFTWSTQASATSAPAAGGRSIALWGDSLTSSRDFIDAALKVAGIASATALPSYIQAGITVPGLRLPLKTACASKGWQVGYAHKQNRHPAPFSPGFLSLSADSPGEFLTLDFRTPSASTRVRELTLHYDKPTPDGSLLLGVAVDEGDETLISLSAAHGTTLQIRPATPLATIKIRLVSGRITLHGLAPLYQDAPATLLDTFSVPGGMLRSWSMLSERLVPAQSGGAPQYGLVLVQYGTNEGANPDFSRAAYLGYLRSNLSRMRKLYPRARCILIGPPDRGGIGKAQSGPLPYAAIHHQIALAQQQAGAEQRCEFWDWQAAMGGPGSAVRWAKMDPPQMQQDLTHLTAKGYEVSGQLFAHALHLNKN
ncbi:MAG: GDSL-type esterase/lipase family protein [Sphingomonadaceae bacterium]